MASADRTVDQAGRRAEGAAGQTATSRLQALPHRRLAIWVYPLAVGLIGLVLSALSLSGTSAGALPQAAPHDPALVAGTPRWARADEYAVSDPYFVAQARLGFPMVSPSAIGGQDLAVVFDVPIWHWTTIFKPYNWPFFVASVEHAFAARWWLVVLSLLLPAYFLLFLLTDRIVLSILFSVTLYLSPYFQWWSLSLDIAIAGLPMAALACFIAAFRTSGVWRRLALLAAWYFAVAFALEFYPPAQIVLALVLGLVGLGWLRSQWPKLTTEGRREVLLSAACIGALTGLVIVVWAVQHQPALSSLAGAAYPGQRRARPGEAPVFQIFGAPFARRLMAFNDPSVNPSEPSSFLLVGPFVSAQLLMVKRWRPDPGAMKVIWAAIIALGIWLVWALVPLPAFVGRIPIINLVPGPRAIVGIGLAAQLVTFLVLATATPRELSSIPAALRRLLAPRFAITLGLVAAAFAVTCYAGVTGYVGPPLAIGAVRLVLWAAAFSAVVAAALLRRPVSASLALLALGAVVCAQVNPLYRGLGPLVNSPVQSMVDRTYAEVGRGTVLSYAGYQGLDPLMVSAGRPTLNAVNLYPNESGWQKLDPDGRYRAAWNRYSFVYFGYGPRGPLTIKELSSLAIAVTVNPCDAALDGLHVTVVVSPIPMTDACLTPSATGRVGQTNLYTYLRQPTSPSPS